MFIGVCGFGETGSGAILDYLNEFDTVDVKDDLEFTYLSNVDGILYLEHALMNPSARTSNSIWAFKRFEDMVNRHKAYYQSCGLPAEIFVGSVKRFLDRVTMVKWYWDYKSYGLISRDFFQYIMTSVIIPRIERKTGHRAKCWPLKEVRFSIRPDCFYEAARQHVDELLKGMGVDQNEVVVFDQPFGTNNPQACFPYLNDPYAIIVDRDPRDLYVSGKTKLMGQWRFFPIETVEDFITYYKALRYKQPYNDCNPRILKVQFEDMVYEYEATSARIRQFLNLPENTRTRSIFNPSRSIANTQVFKRYPNFAEDIKKIEEALPEYLFDFSKYPEPDFKQEMFLWENKGK